MEEIRLNKYLAECGVCSRRDADRLIEQGKVMVDGRPASLGMRLTGAETVTVGGKQLKGREKAVVLAFYKPVGVTCSERDPHADRLIRDMVRYPVRVTYAGRLDKDSEGLLLLSNDGDLIHAAMSGANRHEKEYTVKVDKAVTQDFLDKMSSGVYLKELDLTTRPCRIRQTGKYTFQMVLTQGVNRQIRRMCEAHGFRVRSLLRTRVMNICLGDLKPGEHREILGEELQVLYKMAGLKRPEEREKERQKRGTDRR